MKYALLTIAIGDKYQTMGQITHPYMQKYAQKIGADFIVIDKQKISQTTPHWEKFQLLDYLEKYDRILFLDTDVLVKKNCPNIFDIVPEEKIGAFNEASFTARRDIAIETCAEAYRMKDFRWDGMYYNTGVMVVSKCHRMLFRKPPQEIFNFYEQSYINVMIQRTQTPVFNLPYFYNRMTCMDKMTGKDRYESFMIHYAGVVFHDSTFGVIRKDAEVCDNLPDDYVAKRKIWINVQGGLGDQVQAEPTIRFILNHIWKDEDVRISTHFPELFAHLHAVTMKHGENIWAGSDTEPFTRVTLPGPETPQWRIVSNLMCHTVDFCSMAVLSRILPDDEKNYQMLVKQEAIERVKEFAKIDDFSKCVLVHAGRHWESKTFPINWWQEVVDGIISLGLTPLLVGKDDETRGVVRVAGRGKSIDLTNLLTMDEFIAAISLAPILISNDSSPIHIAGAFDNWIILIPTCKHPDHLLPYRKGTKSYKTMALYKKIALHDMATAPTEIYGSLADKMPGKWEDYLPDTDVVINRIKRISDRLIGLNKISQNYEDELCLTTEVENSTKTQ